MTGKEGGKVKLLSINWVEKNINGSEEVGWYRVFQKEEIINMSVGCVFGTYVERGQRMKLYDETESLRIQNLEPKI